MYSSWTISSQSSIATGPIGKVIGIMILISWYASLYSILAVAVNRLVAIAKPTYYLLIFSDRNTRLCIGWFACADLTLDLVISLDLLCRRDAGRSLQQHNLEI